MRAPKMFKVKRRSERQRDRGADRGCLNVGACGPVQETTSCGIGSVDFGVEERHGPIDTRPEVPAGSELDDFHLVLTTTSAVASFAIQILKTNHPRPREIVGHAKLVAFLVERATGKTVFVLVVRRTKGEGIEPNLRADTPGLGIILYDDRSNTICCSDTSASQKTVDPSFVKLTRAPTGRQADVGRTKGLVIAQAKIKNIRKRAVIRINETRVAVATAIRTRRECYAKAQAIEAGREVVDARDIVVAIETATDFGKSRVARADKRVHDAHTTRCRPSAREGSSRSTGRKRNKARNGAGVDRKTTDRRRTHHQFRASGVFATNFDGTKCITFDEHVHFIHVGTIIGFELDVCAKRQTVIKGNRRNERNLSIFIVLKAFVVIAGQCAAGIRSR